MSRNVSEQEYNNISVLLSYGMSEKEIIDKTGRKHATIGRVKKTVKDGSNYAGYQKYVKEHCSKSTKKKPKDKNPCFAVDQAARQHPKYYDSSPNEKIVAHYNSILLHLIEIGKILNEKHPAT